MRVRLSYDPPPQDECVLMLPIFTWPRNPPRVTHTADSLLIIAYRQRGETWLSRELARAS